MFKNFIKKDMSHVRGGSLILEAQSKNRARNRGKRRN